MNNLVSKDNSFKSDPKYLLNEIKNTAKECKMERDRERM